MNRSASRGTDGERGVVVESGERCAQRTAGEAETYRRQLGTDSLRAREQEGGKDDGVEVTAGGWTESLREVVVVVVAAAVRWLAGWMSGWTGSSAARVAGSACWGGRQTGEEREVAARAAAGGGRHAINGCQTWTRLPGGLRRCSGGQKLPSRFFSCSRVSPCASGAARAQAPAQPTSPRPWERHHLRAESPGAAQPSPAQPSAVQLSGPRPHRTEPSCWLQRVPSTGPGPPH